ncbi:MAG TPA: hypothetical protein DGK91_15130, partial [Clostridium sp.]|nr:hypothetical protein [Clostridium sp.]
IYEERIMPVSYTYIFIEMLLILMVIIGAKTAKNYAPDKIKVLSIFIIILWLLRFTANIFLFLSRNIIFLYILKFFSLINIATIPITALLSLYIFYRNNEIKADYLMVISAIVLMAYTLIIFKMDYNLKRTESFGYIISFENWLFIDFSVIVIVSIIMVCGLIIVGEKLVNSGGVALIITASSVTIIEIVLKLLGIQVMPSLVISDIVWVLA